MQVGITVILCSLLYTTVVLLVYLRKEKLNTFENRVYKALISLNIVGLLLEIGCCYFVINKDVSPVHNVLNVLVNKSFLIFFVAWLTIFALYTFWVSFDKDDLVKRKRKTIIRVIVPFYLISICLAAFLPLNYFYDGTYVYSYGPAVDVIMFVAGITIFFDLYCLFKNIKNVRNKKYVPLFTLVILMMVAMVMRKINPGLILINSELAFISVIMYFTIENPDLQMLLELKENRQLIEKSYESNANFIFNVSQEVKSPIKNIENIYEVLKEEKDIKVIKEGLHAIKRNSDDLNFIVSNLLDVSTLDAHNIKIVDSKYNLHNLLNAIAMRAKQDVKNSVELRFSIAANVPEILHGDEVKLKQILTTIIFNSIKFTKEGFIDIDCAAIVKYDACRLIFTIEDSGCGMSLNEVNELMSYEDELTEDEVALLDNVDLNIKIVSKITRLIGGMILIKSEEGKGSKFTIVLEQKISNPKSSHNAKYDKSYLNSKRVLVVSDVKEDLSMVKRLLSKNDIEVITTMYGKDCVDKIENKEKYDLIMIEDEMRLSSALTTLQELRKIGSKIPVVVAIDKGKEKLKKHYIDEGFVDCILKNKAKSELERIIKNNL